MRVDRLLPVFVAVVATAAAAVSAQTSRQLSILQAEGRRARTSRDLALLQSTARSTDVDTAVQAVRALGRLERPDLITTLLVALRSRLPEVRAEAANAIGQAAQGWGANAPETPLNQAMSALVARLETEDDLDVRGSIAETLGWLPYATATQVAQAETALLEACAVDASVAGRLGVVKGFEALIRLHGERKAPEPATLALLTGLAVPPDAVDTAPRIRRLALMSLIRARAVNDRIAARAALDPDEQVRRLAMRAAALLDDVSEGGAAGILTKGLADPVPMVRIEALASVSVRSRGDVGACAINLGAATDPSPQVALVAIDRLEACGAWPDAVARLEFAAQALAGSGHDGWHRPAHALVALAAADPERARGLLPSFAASPIAFVRVYAARAAGRLHDADALARLAADEDNNVREAAIEQLRLVSGHDADAHYVDSLSRPGYQAVRAAAYALTESTHPDIAIPALQAALARLEDSGGDNASSAREAIRAALVSLGVDAGEPAPPAGLDPPTDLEDWRSVASARARVMMRDGSAFEMTLLAELAPQTVMHFVTLARSGYYDGLTFHRVVPNFVVQGGSPDANEYVGDRLFMDDEVGRWPHTRGAVGLSTRGRDTGDAQFFVDLVDNPGLDHEYTVFAHVLDGLSAVDGILEGDTIARIEILDTP